MDVRRSALRREVMAPRRANSSFGLIAVSTLAMVFAVSSSLLLFSAHRHRVDHDRRDSVVVKSHVLRREPRPPRPLAAPAIVVTERTPATASPAADCKGPVYRSTADGRTEVVFEQCAPRPFARR